MPPRRPPPRRAALLACRGQPASSSRPPAIFSYCAAAGMQGARDCAACSSSMQGHAGVACCPRVLEDKSSFAWSWSGESGNFLELVYM
jgi:hypothetical protein